MNLEPSYREIEGKAEDASPQYTTRCFRHLGELCEYKNVWKEGFIDGYRAAMQEMKK